MRTLTLFALSVIGTAVLSGDAMAFGRKNRGGNGCGGGGGCSGYMYGGYDSGYGYGGHSYGCSGGGYGGYSSYSHGCSGGGYAHGGHHVGSTGTTGDYSVVRGTDGTTYTRGADGSYYSADTISTLGGFTTQPYSSGRVMAGPYPGTYSTYPGTYTYPGMYRGTGYPTGVYPAGYTSGYYGSGVYPAGYNTGPLAMPGVNIGAGGITIVPGLMPGRR